MTTGISVYQMFCAESQRLGLVVAAWALLTGPVGCGSSASDSAPVHDSRATTPQRTDVDMPWAGQTQERRVSPEGFRFSFGDRLPQDQSTHVAREPAGSPGLPAYTNSGVTPEQLTGSNVRAADRPVDGGAATVGSAPADSVSTDTVEDDPSAQDQATVTLDPYWTEREDVD